MRELVCVRCLLGVEKVGRVWVVQGEVKEVEEVKERGKASGREVGWMEEEICGFGEDNMRSLARSWRESKDNYSE